MTDDPKPTITPEKALRFKPLVPNRETIEAMKAAERGEVTTVGHPRKLLKSLNRKSIGQRGAKP